MVLYIYVIKFSSTNKTDRHDVVEGGIKHDKQSPVIKCIWEIWFFFFNQLKCNPAVLKSTGTEIKYELEQKYNSIRYSQFCL